MKCSQMFELKLQYASSNVIYMAHFLMFMKDFVKKHEIIFRIWEVCYINNISL